MLASERGLVQKARRRPDGLCRGQRGQGVAEPVHRSAFHVDAASGMRGAQTGGLVEQRAGLRRVRDVALEEDDAARAHQFEPGTLERREFGTAESHH